MPLPSCRASRSPKNVSSKDRSAGVPNGTWSIRQPPAQLRMPRRPRVRQQAVNRLPAYVSLSNGLTSIVSPS